jgi:hypothetical protein
MFRRAIFVAHFFTKKICRRDVVRAMTLARSTGPIVAGKICARANAA